MKFGFIEFCYFSSDLLLSNLDQKSIKWPDPQHENAITLASSLSSYSNYLTKSNKGLQKRQQSLFPMRQV